MENEKPRIRIELTEDQKQKIKQASGEEISVIEFTMQELEERIAPRIWQVVVSDDAPRVGSPLFVELELTEEQQRQILQQTGISLGGIVFESTARSIRVSLPDWR